VHRSGNGKHLCYRRFGLSGNWNRGLNRPWRATCSPNYVECAVATTSGSSMDANGNQITNDQMEWFTDTTGVMCLRQVAAGLRHLLKVLTYVTNQWHGECDSDIQDHTVQTVFGCGSGNTTRLLTPRTSHTSHGSYYQFSMRRRRAMARMSPGRLSSSDCPQGAQSPTHTRQY